jgi:chloramphenicol-sensitive protein RarD
VSTSTRDARGVRYAIGAYLVWGLLPIYFKVLEPVPPLEILSHRIVWSVALLAVLLARAGGGAAFRAAFRREVLPVVSVTTLLITTNWGVYIWAVQAGRIVEASLGYFLNPLANVVLGVAFLGESLSRRQKMAIAIATAGVLVLVVRAGTFPWLALLLASSFALYGLVRKRAALDAVGGLLAETTLVAPVALAFLAWRGATGAGAFGTALRPTLLLAAAGAITATPLVWFAIAVGRLRLSTVGLVQYLTPTLQFLCGVLLYREPFTPAHAAAFGLIWCSLALYTWDALARLRPLERG